MVRKASHKWAFKPGMRAGAYSWRSSAKAIERLKSAKTEIRSVGRKDPVTAAEGVIALAQRIWPAFEHIDTSSGALGSPFDIDEAVEHVMAASERTRQEDQALRELEKLGANASADPQMLARLQARIAEIRNGPG